MQELYKVHRPTTLAEMVGQREAVKTLDAYLDDDRVPHTVLLIGPSGTGKTTIARIMKEELGCSDQDFYEINAADFTGIDMVRGIRKRVGLAPIGGECRVWVIDEAHQLTSQAQNAFLKLLEDTPSHCYFFLATTNPEKILKTIKTRACTIQLSDLSINDLEAIIESVCEKEEVDLDEDEMKALCEAADGSARQALVILDAIKGLDPDDRLAAIQKADVKRQSIEICRGLLNPRAKWSDVAAVVKGTDENEAESLRWMVLGYMRNVLLGDGKMSSRAAMVIEAFEDNFFDTKKAGLALACYRVVVGE